MDILNKSTRLLAAARSAGLRVATAESCTGGLVAGAITEVAGSSDVFDRGFITYSNQAKVELLGVLPASLQSFGAVSEPVAAEMAEGALARSDADLAVSVTGIAGPGGSDCKPEGRVCFAIMVKNGKARVETIEFGVIGRANVRAASVSHALDLLISACPQTAS